jgi:ribosomal protein S16
MNNDSDDEKEKEEKDYFGLDYQNYLDAPHFNPSLGTGKKDTGAETPSNNSMFEKIDNIGNYHPQTELKKDDKKFKDKHKLKHKNSEAGNSSNDLIKTLQKKKARGDEGVNKKKKKKTKTEMGLTLKNKTEINPEIKKKENEKKIYEMFTQEDEQFYDVYNDENPISGDLFNSLNDDDIAEVNRIRPEYKSQINPDIPESLDMYISSNQ